MSRIPPAPESGPPLSSMPPTARETEHTGLERRSGGDILDHDQRQRVELIRHLAGSHPSVRYLLGVIDDIAPGRR